MNRNVPTLPATPDPMAMTEAPPDSWQRHTPYPGTIIMPPPKSSLLGRIAMGLLCSTVVTVVMYFMQLRMFIIHLLAFIVAMFGGGTYDVKSKSEDGKAVAAVASSQGKGFLSKVLDQAKEKGKEAAEVTAQPVKHVIQETKTKVEHVEKKVVETKDAAFQKLEELKLARQKAHDEAEAMEKKRLLARASELQIVASDDWTLAELRRAVADAEQKRLLALWHKRYNGSCPRCRQPMKVSLRGHYPALCPRCGTSSSQASIRALAPPMPRTFRGF